MKAKSMWKFRIYMSLVIGTGLTLLVFFTLDMTWLLGIAALMPGAALAFVAFPHSSSHVPMLVVNSLLYSAIALPFVSVGMRRSRIERPVRFAVVSTIAALTFLGCIWLGGEYYDETGHGLCQNGVVSELPSPDGSYKSVTFVRDCGATTDLSTQLSVMKSTRKLNHADKGNIFAADSAHEAPVNGQGAIDVRVAWTSPTTIKVQYPGTARVFSKKDNYRNISVKYETQ